MTSVVALGVNFSCLQHERRCVIVQILLRAVPLFYLTQSVVFPKLSKFIVPLLNHLVCEDSVDVSHQEFSSA